MRLVEKTRNILFHLAAVNLSRNDFAAFYAVPYALMTLALVYMCYVQARADKWVLSGLLRYVSDDPSAIYWLSLGLAATILLCSTLGTFMASSIRQKDLHKEKMKDADDNPVDNPRRAYHRKQLFIFETLRWSAFLITVILSLLTYQPTKQQFEGDQIALIQGQRDKDDALSNKIATERQLILSQFQSDSITLERNHEKIFAIKAGLNGSKLKAAKEEIGQQEKRLKGKNLTPIEKKEIDIRILELIRKSKTYDAHVKRQTASITNQRNKEMAALVRAKNSKLNQIASHYLARDSIYLSEFVGEKDALNETILTSSGLVMGYNAAVNFLVMILVWGLSSYINGATFGVTPYEFEKIETKQSGATSRNKNRNNSAKKTQRSTGKNRKRNAGKPVATGGSEDKLLAFLKAARTTYKSNLRANEANKRNGKASENTDDHIEKWKRKIEEVEKEIAVIKDGEKGRQRPNGHKMNGVNGHKLEA